MKKMVVFLYMIALIVSLIGCNQPEMQNASEPSTEYETRYQYDSIPVFSYDEDRKKYVDGIPGVITTGFVNTTETEVTYDNLVELAKKECTVSWNDVNIHRDPDAGVWCVNFSMKNWAGGDQTVYISDNGKTLLVVYGE